MQVVAKLVAAFMVAIATLGVGLVLLVGLPSHWPYGGASGDALNDALNIYTEVHAVFLVVALFYLLWRRLSWSSVRTFAVASFVIVVGYFLFFYLIGQDAERALGGL